MNRFFFIAIILITTLIGYSIYSSILKSKEAYKFFYLSNINGVISKVKRKSAGEVIIEVGSGVYKFVPVNVDGLVFEYSVQPGDSIVKPALMDTIMIYNENRELKFLFIKPSNKSHFAFVGVLPQLARMLCVGAVREVIRAESLLKLHVYISLNLELSSSKEIWKYMRGKIVGWS